MLPVSRSLVAVVMLVNDAIGDLNVLPCLIPGYEHCSFRARQAVLCFMLLLSLTCDLPLTHRYGRPPENETEAH